MLSLDLKWKSCLDIYIVVSFFGGIFRIFFGKGNQCENGCFSQDPIGDVSFASIVL